MAKTKCSFLLSALILSFFMLITGCRDNSVAPAPNPPPGGGGGGGNPKAVSFESNVLPILESHGCTSCHGGTNGLFVGTVSQLLKGGLHGPAVTPGNADGSLIIQKTSPNPPFGARMPFGGAALSDAEIQTIKDWINQGAKDN